MPDYLVVFSKDNAYVVLRKEDIDKYEKYPNALLNPRLSQVQKLNTKYWKFDGTHIVPMTIKERIARDKIKDINPIKPMYLFKIYPKLKYAYAPMVLTLIYALWTINFIRATHG